MSVNPLTSQPGRNCGPLALLWIVALRDMPSSPLTPRSHAGQAKSPVKQTFEHSQGTDRFPVNQSYYIL